MTNEQYLDQQGITGDARLACLDAMLAAGENHWWLSDDPKVRASGQMQTETLLYSFKQFHQDIEVLLGRPVYTHEFGLRWQALQKEAAEAMAGIQHTDAEKQQALATGLRVLQEHTEQVIVVEPPQENQTLDQMNLIEAIHTLYEEPSAVAIQSTVDGWLYRVKREGDEGFFLRRDQVGSILSEEVQFANEGELLAWWSTKRQEGK